MLKRGLILALLLGFAAPVYASTHKENYDVPCSTLWQAVRDTLRNSGKYGIIGISSEEMTASYNMGGNITGKRVNSVMLNVKGEKSCEMQVQTAFSGLVNNDYGDFKDRVKKSLEKLASATPPVKPGEKPTTPDAAPAKDDKAAPAPTKGADKN